MNTPTYYAHSTQRLDKSDWQELSVHLNETGALARNYASCFEAGDWGYLAGLLHDAGKATQDFIFRLEGRPIKVNHSIFGARVAQKECGRLGLLLSYIIAGHHGGLPDGGIQEGQLHYRLKHERIPADVSRIVDIADLINPNLPFSLQRNRAVFSLSFFTRMLFSCLTDADFLNTENFCAPDKATLRHCSNQHSLASLQGMLNAHLEVLQNQAKTSVVNQLRASVLADCRTAATKKTGFFSLTVPTGGGKTLSSLAFALDHAVNHGLQRIIYAIPFTSIIEQNAQIFSFVLGQENVLEHHCNYTEKDEPEAGYDKWRGLAAENWAAPVVVTTNVQFFESLFSNRSSRCRKLHNIARSVIILDEAQTIPTDFLEPCLAALRELVEHYGCTVLLCTATQPALDDESVRTPLGAIREIITNPSKLYSALKRTQVRFIGTLTDEDVASRLDGHEQALCIVNTKSQARRIFEALQNRDAAFHLSTNMYPAHRRRVLDAIRQRLKDGLPCRVVSTSLIESGVDISLPVIYRAMTGLDAIAQAAGRCNREGDLPELGQVFVFESEKMPSMPWLRRRATRAAETLRALPDEEPLGLVTMRRYFELFYDGEDLDKKRIMKRLGGSVTPEMIFPFKEIAQDFRFIPDEEFALIIPADQKAENLIQELRHTKFPRSTLRKLQHYTVTIRSKDLAKLQQARAIETINDQYPVLRNMTAYDKDGVGLRVDASEIWEPDALIT